MKTKLFLFLILTICLNSYAQLSSVAIVGSGAGGWPSDPSIDLHQMSSTDGEHWTLSNLALTTGEIKFRADNAWTLNWGDVSFPNGIGLPSGSNIYCVAGVYDVAFNSTTGAYAFTSTGNPAPVVKLINAGVVIDMVTNDLVQYTALNVNLLAGNTSFSVDGNLLGGTGFPNGTADTPDTFIDSTAGVYTSITLNISTGVYQFVAAPVISITGTAVGGSGDGFDFDMTTTDGIMYHYQQLATTTGLLKFRTNHLWDISYGGDSFPYGTGVVDGNEIPVPQGTWDVTFNIQTRAYNFSGGALATTIALVGSGAGGWPGSDTNPGPFDLYQMSTEDGVNFTLYNVTLTDGEVKFRADNSWLLNWGAPEFPTGVAVQNGNNILTVAGNYTVNFNAMSGEYSFAAPLRMAIVGSAVGGWPTGVAGEVDLHQLESTDGVHFRLNNITLTDGYAKFRQNNSWDVNWGGTSLSGPLVFNGPDIPVTAGAYSIGVNRVDGSYSFGEALGVQPFAKADFKVYPNPTANLWNFSAAKGQIQSVRIVDVLGKTVGNVSAATADVVFNASALQTGVYFAQIITESATATVKLLKK